MNKFLLWNSEESSIVISNTQKELEISTHKGKIIIKDLKYGETLYSTKNKKYYILPPTNEEINKKIEKTTNIFVIKDITQILGFTSLNKNSTVLEIGSGSGGLTIFLSNFVKKVVSIDINYKNIKNTQRNIKKYSNFTQDIILLLSNEKRYIFKKESFDCIVIDLPEPSTYVELVKDTLKIGGDLIFAVPNVEQVKQAREVFSKNNFVYFRTIETWQRKWVIRPNYSRPHHEMQAHSIFFTFCKKVNNSQ